jgi:hypothetical protein
MYPNLRYIHAFGGVRVQGYITKVHVKWVGWFLELSEMQRAFFSSCTHAYMHQCRTVPIQRGRLRDGRHTHVFNRACQRGLKFQSTDVETGTCYLACKDDETNRLALKGGHTTDPHERMRRQSCTKVSLPLTKCISSGDSCSYCSLERGVFPCRLEL